MGQTGLLNTDDTCLYIYRALDTIPVKQILYWKVLVKIVYAPRWNIDGAYYSWFVHLSVFLSAICPQTLMLHIHITFVLCKLHCKYLVCVCLGQAPSDDINVVHLLTLTLWPFMTPPGFGIARICIYSQAFMDRQTHRHIYTHIV